MKWSGNCLDPISQLRAATTSDEWEETWKHAIMVSFIVN